MNGVRGWMVMTKVFKFDGLSVENLCDGQNGSKALDEK
jgi:hypothetical protein